MARVNLIRKNKKTKKKSYMRGTEMKYYGIKISKIYLKGREGESFREREKKNFRWLFTFQL